MIPAVDNAHVAESVALLTDMYRTLKVVPGLVSSYATQIQRLEDAIWGVINARMLTSTSGPTGVHLDTVGSLVGEPRRGRSDADYLAAVRVRIRVDRSRGTTEDIIQIAALLGATVLAYLESSPAAYTLVLRQLAGVAGVVPLLAAARPAGVAADLIYTTWPITQDWIPSSSVGSVPLATGLADLAGRTPLLDTKPASVTSI